MMGAVEKEDLDELIKVLKQAVKEAERLVDSTGGDDRVDRCRENVRNFRTTASMLGIPLLEQVGLALEDYIDRELASVNALGMAEVFPFAHAASALVDEMRRAAAGDGELGFDAQEIIGILAVASGQDSGGEITELSADEFPAGFFKDSDQLVQAESVAQPFVAPVEEASESAVVPLLLDAAEESLSVEPVTADFSRLSRIIENLGGELVLAGDEGGGEGSFQIIFSSSPKNLEKIETLLSPFDPNPEFGHRLTKQDAKTEKILGAIRKFMQALSTGEVAEAQEVLLELAEQQGSGLYQHIGVLARQLHDSLRNFANTIDPNLVEMVENKLPDSGSRLEHILELTEKAANTTLDHVEAMKDRNLEEQAKLTQLHEIFDGLWAVGDAAQKRLDKTHRLLGDLRVSFAETSSDLITVLTAQDYQDLTGQVILKIIQLLKDLEKNLVDIIRTFGLKSDGRKAEATDELYGPAHMGKTEALHSQVDVDSLLAEFGF
jgi:chemotaxis protein CheZ